MATTRLAVSARVSSLPRPRARRSRSTPLLLLLATALLSASFAFAQGNTAAGVWLGAIEIPGSPLEVQVTLEVEQGAWTGTIDIPVQGAMGVPLAPLTVDGAEVTFTIEGVPGEPTFTGEVAGDTLAGTFSQAGQQFPYVLSRAGAQEADGAAETVDQAGEYVDPQGRFSVQVPAGWRATEEEGFVRVTSPEGGLQLAIVVSQASDPDAAVAAAWALTAPQLALEPVQTLEPPSEPGVDRSLVMNYDVGDPNQIYQALAQVVGQHTYVMLVDAELAELQRRGAQLQVVASSFRITDVEAADLSGAQTREVQAVADEFSAFIVEAIEAFSIPGASVAIVQDGRVVYLEGFGVTRAGGDEPLTPSTQVMIGSTGKTMTSMLIAGLVDDGVIGWDTPVVDVLPTFAVADQALTSQITFRNLLCACTGVPRRDIELAFNYDELTAEAVIESLQGFEFFTGFGEAFQYSNQLVATAGYAAAAAAGAPYGALYAGYQAALAEYVLEPIGMPDTTLDFGKVLARADHAEPHQLNVESGRYEPIDVAVEELLVPVGPAGVHWSTAEDMARYLLTLLAGGVAPDGQRVVSDQSLGETWQPQVQISANDSYALGWIVSDYRGLPVMSHGGNTLGFTSEMLFLPTADLGVVLIANAQNANPFTSLVTGRLLELVFDQPAEAPAQLAFQVQQMEQALVEGRAQLVDRVPLVDALGLIGAYTNPALGTISLRLEDGQLLLDVGEWSAQVRPLLDRQGEFDHYVTYGPPLTGLPLRVTLDEDGVPSLVAGEGLLSYPFQRLR